MNYLLFILYLVIGCFFITRISFIKNSGLTTRVIIILFLLKIIAGILIGWLSQKFYPQGNDYWGLNTAGWNDHRILVSDPKLFFEDIFNSSYPNGYDKFFNSTGSYWNDLRNTLIIKLLAILDIFSRGNYYVNSIFLNFIGFFGHVGLFRVFSDIFKQKKWAVITGCFLLPSTLYFTSGIHKDLIVFTLLGLYCYALYYSVQKRSKQKYIITICATLFLLLLIRNFVALAIIPASIAFIISYNLNINKLLIYFATYCIAFLLIALMQFIRPSFQPLNIIVQKQKDFFELPYATSQLDTHVLEPNMKSVLTNVPQALNHSILRPYLWEHPTNFLIPLSIELFIYELLFLIMLAWHQKNTMLMNNFVLFGLFFCLTLLLFTGYIVPNIGSLVRYRSIYLPFLLTPVLCSINWKALGRKNR